MMAEGFVYAVQRLAIVSLLSLPVTACGQPVISGSDEVAMQARVYRKGVVLKKVPEIVDVKSRYLFYLHGGIIENAGIRPTDPRFGVYEYEEILKTLANKGFIVISEARAKDTDPKQYADKLVLQIRGLIKDSVPPRLITVVGASKGAVITMLTSTLLKNKDVNFVIMSNCNDWVDQNFHIDLYGNVLSIYDINDEFGRTCQKFFDKAGGLTRRHEVELKVGSGHAVLYKPLKEWVDLVVEWAQQSPN